MFLSQVMNLIGDVKGKVAVMVDDMIDTAGTPKVSVALYWCSLFLTYLHQDLRNHLFLQKMA